MTRENILDAVNAIFPDRAAAALVRAAETLLVPFGARAPLYLRALILDAAAAHGKAMGEAMRGGSDAS